MGRPLPGLFGVAVSGGAASSDALDRMLPAFHPSTPTDGRLESLRIDSPLGAFACLHHGLFDHSVLATTPQQDVGLLIDGWIWDPPRCQPCESQEPELDAAQECLRAYLDRGIDFVRQLNGEFNLVVCDDRQGVVWLTNDRFGLRPLQHGIFSGVLYFAPEGKAILAGTNQAPRLDMQMVVNWLSVGRTLLGDRTFFEGIGVLPPASILCWRDGRVERRVYWDYVYDPVEHVDQTFVQELADVFRRAVARRVRPHRRYGVTLSGGLDSRVVAHALAGAVSEPVVACSFGMPDSDEVLIAKTVAHRLGLTWLPIPLDAGDFVQLAEEGVRFSEGMEIFVQGYGLKVYPNLREKADVAFSGLALDLTLGGSYLEDRMVSPYAQLEEVKRLVQANSSYFDADMVFSLFGGAEAGQIAERLFSEAWDDGMGGASPSDRADRFALRNRVRRTTFLRQNWQRLFLEDASPTFDNEFVDLLLRVPAIERVNHKLYQKFMSHLCPELMDIPYQRTLLPPTVPSTLWARATRLEEEREGLLTDVWRETSGAVHVPYRRYSTNYDEWLRLHSRWINFTDDLLSRRESRLQRIGICLDPIHTMLQEHRDGIRSHRARLLQLMTLELFLRVFFG